MKRVFASRMARLLGGATVAIVAFIATPSAGRMPAATRYDALPRPSERLAHPILVPHCGMQIVEWRPTATLIPETSQSEQGLAVLDDTCRAAFDRYGAFLRHKKLPRLHLRPESLPVISLLPGNTLLDGKSPRALNDLPTRFEAVAPGCCYWGLYVDSLNHLFLRNDPLIKDENGALTANPRFVRTLTHEISHILSSRLGVWDVVGYDRQRDEDLAEEFVAFMGMRFPAESSAEDLAFHRGAGARPASPVTEAAATATKPQAPPTSASANTSPQR
ncbi:MAG: hypothetical protein JOZ69_09935 [Myxococcales bacterium]|nr:hypothetical protein [Myxococcales bacterium]